MQRRRKPQAVAPVRLGSPKRFNKQMHNLIQHQIELAQFPAQVQITHFTEGQGLVFRATEGQRGYEILLTDEAANMYGEGPSVSMVLSTLKHVLTQQLPPIQPDGTFKRTVFEGD